MLVPIHLAQTTRTVRHLHACSSLMAGGLFRARRNLPPKNNEWGPLTDLPDFSVIGKETPLFTSVGQKKRAVKSIIQNLNIMRLISELNETKSSYEANLKENAILREQRELKLLKSKGSNKL